MSSDAGAPAGPEALEQAINEPGDHNVGVDGKPIDQGGAEPEGAETEKSGLDTSGAAPSVFDPPEVVAEREKQEKEAEAGKPGEADDATSESEKEKASAEEGAEGAPEQYEPFEFPEGMEGADEERMGLFSQIAKDANLTQGQAQHLITLASEHTGAVVLETTQKILEAQSGKQAEIHAQWEAERKAHPTLGGENYEASHEAANLAVDEIERTIGLPLRDHLRLTGLGNNPGIWGLLAVAGQSLAPDTLPRGFRPGGRTQADADDGSGPTIYASDGIGSAER